MKNEKEFGIGLKSFLLNPCYITRKLLYKSIKNNAGFINGYVLDFGCGEKPYKDLFKFKKYIGVDYASTGHDNSSNNIDIYWNGNELPVEDKFFDSFVCTEVLEHVFDLNTTLYEIQRVLKTGGKGIITIPFMIGEHEKPYDFARYTYFGIEDILKKYNFKIIKHNRLGNYRLTLLQLNRTYISEAIHGLNNIYISFLLNMIIGFPAQIIINSLSLINLSRNQNVYLSNFLVVEKI